MKLSLLDILNMRCVGHPSWKIEKFRGKGQAYRQTVEIIRVSKWLLKL